jgi:hypothetical protein
MKLSLALILAALCACVNTETVILDDDGNPVAYTKRENFMRVGQGIVWIDITDEKVELSQIASEDAASEQLKQMWKTLNTTAQYFIVGAGIGAAVGQPAAGGAAGAIAAQIQKLRSGKSGETPPPPGGLTFEAIIPATP